MRSRAIETGIACIAFLMGLFWIIVPSYWFYVDSIGYMAAFLEERKFVNLWHIYHPLFPGLWRWIWTSDAVRANPLDALRNGSVMISLAGGIGIWATYRWGRLSGLKPGPALLAAAVLCGLGAWAYFSAQWAAFIPAIAFMLYAFLIVAGGYAGKSGTSDVVSPRPLRMLAAGIILGISAGFHGTAILSLPGFMVAIGGRGRFRRWLWFLAGFVATVAVIWAIGAKEYKDLSDGRTFSDWIATSYASEGRFWVKFHYLYILQAMVIGNLRTLFMGYSSGVWAPEFLSQPTSIAMRWWYEPLQMAGYVLTSTGILISIFALAPGSRAKTVPANSPRLHNFKWGLFTAWLPFAVFTSLYAAYTARHRLFAWALLIWLFIPFFARAYSSSRRSAALAGIALIVAGLWTHNYITGPLQWCNIESNPYILEAVMITKSSRGTAPVIFESSPQGFERAMNLRLFGMGNFASVLRDMNGRPMEYFAVAMKRHKGFRITGEAMEELGWQVTPDGDKLLTGEEMAIIENFALEGIVPLSKTTTPIGDIYLLGWE